MDPQIVAQAIFFLHETDWMTKIDCSVENVHLCH